MTVPTAPDGNQTVLYQLLQAKLDVPLDQFIADARKKGVTYLAIAEDLRNRTETYVTHESIRRWYVKAHPESEAA